ncbi:MAG TPA: gp58-like family protein, partial [Subdoligranulum variabile]|nr:gp58-like family protein [Subdoligranulum variabile]
MFLHRIRLPDGIDLTSGTAAGKNAIRSVTVTEQVNDQTDLCPGAACAACAEIELWVPENRLQIGQGDELTLFRTDTLTGTETPVGIFLAEKPVKTSANVCKVTAYDRMTLLDKTLSPWLKAHQKDFPLALTAFIQQVCAQCGVSLADDALDGLPNGSYRVRAFYADDLTGRQLIQWAAQAACRYARINTDGKLTFSWYTAPEAVWSLGPGAQAARTQLRLAGQTLRTAAGMVWRFGQRQAAYRQSGLTYEEYVTAPLDKVQIRQSDSDVGVIYPPDAAGTNALVLQGNLLLTTDSAEELWPVAQQIFAGMQGLCYTPLTVELPAEAGVCPAPGQQLAVRDAYGQQHDVCLMRRTTAGQKMTLEATGNARRDGTTAVNNRTYRDLNGKMLEIQTSVDGLSVKASELAGNYTELNLDVEGLSARTQNLEGDYTQLDLEVGGLSARTQNLEGDATQLRQTVDGLDLTVVKKGQVRTQFAADADSVDITSGLISFKSNTLAVDSSNFKLNAAGNVTASGSFSSNNGVGGAGRNESTLSSGSIAFRRTTSAGKNLLAAEMYGLGANAAHGCMNIYGTDASNSNNIGQFIVQGSYTGGQVWIRNAAGQNEITLFGGNGGNAGFEGNVDIKGETGLG